MMSKAFLVFYLPLVMHLVYQGAPIFYIPERRANKVLIHMIISSHWGPYRLLRNKPISTSSHGENSGARRHAIRLD
jgi:hypothetical protein